MTALTTERFWYPHGETVQLTDGGFLWDPTDEFTQHFNINLVALRDRRNSPCLVLLGEPGSGKSTSLEADFDDSRESGEPALRFDLAQYGSDEALAGGIFGDPAWQEWREGGPLTIYLDSYDECRLSLRNAAQVISRELGRLPGLERLNLRLASRAGVWPPYLEDALRGCWGDQVEVYDLAPLRRIDAVSIVRESGIRDPHAFVRAVADVDAMPLATSPLSLLMLARLYLQNSSLPARRSDLFEQACLSLCTEHNPSRLASGYRGMISPMQRLAIASRLAALCTLCARVGVWLGPDDQRPDNSWLVIGECDGGLESAAGTEFHVTSEMIREVVSDTQLFRPQGSERAVWFHRSYAEYLTARYLDNMHGVQIEQLESLLCHPSLRGHIVPQLRGVATWMGTRPDVLRLICQCDPQAVLFVDIDVHSDSDRNIAVDAILQAARDTQLSDFGLSSSRYRRLRHPGLPEQIRPIIADRSRSRLERRVAIDLAEQCCLSDLQSPLLSVVMDRDDDYHLRAWALAALSESPDVTTRAGLRRLLSNGLDDDVDDDLRGYALRALWPNDLSIDEILPLLTPLKRSYYDGGYCHFIYHDFPAGLPPEHLARALAWLNGLPDDQLADPPFSNLLDDTLTRSLEQPLSEELRASIGRAFWRKLRAQERWSNQEAEARFAALLEDAAKRLALLASLFSCLPTDEQHLWRVVVSFEPKIVRAVDISWLLERLDRERERPVRQLVANLAAYFLSHCSRNDFERILAAAETHPELHESLSPVIDPIPLNSDRANQLRQAYASQLSRPDARRQAPLLDPPPRERILRLLDRSETGESDAWIDITYGITLTPTSQHYGHLRDADLSSQPGWADADADFRERLIAAAERYLAQSSPDAEAWIDDPQGSWTDPPIAGIKALWLLRDAAPERFSSLSAATWKRWTPAILHYRASGAEKEHLQRRLTAHAYNQSPAGFLNWLTRLLRRDNAARLIVSEPQQDGPPVDREEFMPTDIGRRISECWDEQLAAAIRNFAMSDATNPTVYANLIDALLSHRDFATIQTIEEQLATAASGQVTDRQRLCVAASSLLKYAPALAIQEIARLADVDAPLCRDIFSRWANETPFAAHAEAVAVLREDQAADLYLLMRRTLPHPARQEADNDAATHVLSQIPGYIAAQGTFTAIAAIDRLLAAYSADQALRFIRLDAERFALEATWIPCQPADVLALVRDQQKRLIRSGEELVEVVKESIRRFEQELQGETPQNFTLWDEQPHSRDDPIVFRPKNEESLSNVLRKHFERDLRDRGIVTNREVEIRPRQGSGGSPGEYTDIQIDAVSLRPEDASIARIRAIAELKGCWNPGIDSAMQLQLRDRYLKDNDCYHGLYIVGWYLCPQWDADDYRLAAATSLMPATIDEARQKFEDQAKSLSGNGVTLAASVIDCRLR